MLGASGILAAALATHAGLMSFLGDRVYGDVLKAVHFGWLVAIGVYDPARDVVNSKTFVGPWLDHRLFAAAGLPGLRAASLALFVATGALLASIARGRFDERTRLLALFLFAFYVGTQRTIVAGELDDHVATLLLAAGVFLVLERARLVLGCAVIGCGFLFKFWVAIFGFGLVVWLAAAGRSRRIPATVCALGVPFVALALVDGGGSLRALTVSTGLSLRFSTWGTVAFKCVSTGLLPVVAVTIAAWLERGRRDDDLLLVCLSCSYLAYVLLARDAHAATTMMSTTLVFAAPLVAAWMLARAGTLAPARRRVALALLVAVYPTATTMVTALHLHRDTHVMRLAERPEDAARTFRYNRPPRAP